MVNILLVQVVDKQGPNSFLPLAVGYLWAYCQTDPLIKENTTLCDVLIEKKDPEKYVKELGVTPHIVAMSTYVWNYKYNQVLAQTIKKHYPKCLVVVGGPQIDRHDPKFFEKHPMFDVAVMGEGEVAFKDIVSTYLVGKTYRGIVNTFTKFDKDIPNTYRMKNVNTIPSPILTGFYEDIIRKTEEELGPQLWQISFETLRGCPYKCSYCDIGDQYWCGVSVFDEGRIYKEIDWIVSNKIEYVSVCDSNWGSQKRDGEITKYVIDKKQQTGYPNIWDVTWAKTNLQEIFDIALLDKVSDTKIFKGVTFAMQSLNDPTLSSTSRVNVNREKTREFLEKYKNNNIPTYSELIWPLPNETYQTLKSNIQSLIEMGQNNFLMVHPLMVTPNAPMGRPEYLEKYGIETRELMLDTFYLNVQNINKQIGESCLFAVQTHTAKQSDVIDGHVFSYLLILFYYYGWGHYLLEYLKNRHQHNHVDVVENMIGYFDEKTLIGREILETRRQLNEVFLSGGFWGRQVLGEDDILWEYKGASSIIFDQNRTQVKNELKKFVGDVYKIDADEVIDLNFDMCFDWRVKYPKHKTYPTDLVRDFLFLDKKELNFNHDDGGKIVDPLLFYHRAYHHQRKNGYWKCRVK